jgi:hypothetical protein
MFDLIRTPKTESEFFIDEVMADMNNNLGNEQKGCHNRFTSFRGSIGHLV